MTGNQGTGSGIYAHIINRCYAMGYWLSDQATWFTNPDLQWEETNTDNIGLNIGLLKNRITIEADYYKKNTDNLITAGQFAMVSWAQMVARVRWMLHW